MSVRSLSLELARRLQDAGLAWHPESGDAFTIDGPEFDDEVFTVSDMTIELHEFDTGTILGFNGTTEWALDQVALEGALWLPREDQLRELLGESFSSLQKVDDRLVVEFDVAGMLQRVDAASAQDAYALALLAVFESRAAHHSGH